MNCNDSRYKCGEIYPSSCVLYTGDLPTFIVADSIPCDANIDDVIEQMNIKLSLLLDGNNLTAIDKKCLVFDPATVTIKGLHQVQITKICDLNSRLGTLELLVGNLNIGNELINIDLGCLAPQAAPCAQGTNLYSLVSILTVLKNEICTIKTFLNL